MAGVRRYSYRVVFDSNGARWEIVDGGQNGRFLNAPTIWSMPYLPEHDGLGQPPLEFRQRYEALLAESGFIQALEPPHVNIVERVSDEDECAWDQPCAYGYRVESHAVYCHNEAWPYSPFKCRRRSGQSMRGDEAWPHAGCPGFKPNPLYIEEALR